MVWCSHLFKSFSQFVVIHIVKGFGIVNKAEIDVLLEVSCFFDNRADVGNSIFGSSAFSKTSLNSWKFMVHIYNSDGLEIIDARGIPYFPRDKICQYVNSYNGSTAVWM